jgi:ribosome-associated translation inhibitor RaiA
MHITVGGKGVEAGEALKTHVTDGLAAVTRSYSARCWIRM